MKNYLVFPLDDGGEIIFQIASPEGKAGFVRAGTENDKNMTLAQVSLQQAIGKARFLSTAMIDTFSEQLNPPDEVAVQFGMSMEEFGASISQDIQNANLVVTLKWHSVKSNLNKE